jgi:glycosyltransferase involved in cell wall biosynthesis
MGVNTDPAATRIGILSSPANAHARRWAGALAAVGYPVHLYTADPAPVDIPGVCVRTLNPAVRRLTYWHYVWLAGALRRQVQADGITVLHPLHLTPYGSWALWSHTGLPIVAAAMGADVLEYLPPTDPSYIPPERAWANSSGLAHAWHSHYHQVKRRYFGWQVRRVVRQAAALTVDSQVVGQALTRYLGADPNRIHLVRWGIDPTQLEPTPQAIEEVRTLLRLEPHQRILLSPRGLNAVYQADRILEAFEQLLLTQTLPEPWVAVMLGAGYGLGTPMVETCKRLANAWPHRFRWCTHYLNAEQMVALWSLTDVMIAIPVADAYSSALAEARWAGVVPIVNALPAVCEVAEHGTHAYILPDTRVPTLVEACRTVLNNLPLWQERIRQPNREWLLRHGLLGRGVEQFRRILQHLPPGSTRAV